MTQELVLASNADAYRASTDAANLCKEIVVATASNIQGKKYVGVEGWQAIAIAHGCAAGARDVEKVDGGVRAIGEVRRMSDGVVISTAEGFVGEDEPTWYGGTLRGKTLPKRADYAIRAMAQTRAISRACRSAFAHVVVMMKAGLATTPAEEVPFEGFDNGNVIDAEPQEKVPGIHKIKERLREMMTAGDDPGMTLEGFRDLKRANKDDLKTIRDANHSWWTGDGEDFEGYGPWMERRQRELEAADETTALVRSMQDNDTQQSLTNWMAANESAIEELSSADRDRFDLALDARSQAIALMDGAN